MYRRKEIGLTIASAEKKGEREREGRERERDAVEVKMGSSETRLKRWRRSRGRREGTSLVLFRRVLTLRKLQRQP